MKKSRSVVVKALLMVTQTGISMLVPIFLGAWVGYQLDRWLKAGCFFLIFLLFGIMAAFRNVYRMLKPFFEVDFEREKKQQAYWDALHPAASDSEEAEPLLPEESGIVLRRRREQLLQKQEPVAEDVKETSSRQKAEEEFDAWRRERESRDERVV